MVKTDTEVRAGRVVLAARDVRDRTRDRTRDCSPTRVRTLVRARTRVHTRVRTRGLGRSPRRDRPCRANSTRSAAVRVNAVTFALALVLVLVGLPVLFVVDRLAVDCRLVVYRLSICCDLL